MERNYSIALNRSFPFQFLIGLSALRKRPLINPRFVADEWQEWKFRYLPVFVGFLYAVVSSVPSGFLMIRQSRKGSSLFSFSLSAVN